jgi:hypothetical protein
MAVNKGQGLKSNDSDLSSQEAKASPDAEDAIEHAADPDTTITHPDDEELSTVSDFPRSVEVGSGEYQLTHVVQEAKRDSGLTAKQWNELSQGERTAHITTTLSRLREEADAELLKARAEQADAEELPGATENVRVHETRGVGGRYVALGGGERVRVAEASTRPDAPILDDADLVPAGDEG